MRASGRIAVVFSRPTTHRTLQLKADDARVRAATPGEAAIVADYVDAFAREIGVMGHTAEQAGAMFQFRADDLVAIDFTPSAAFDQTPGRKPARRSALPDDPTTVDAIRDCLEGAMPASVATCAPDGTPNVWYLSQVSLRRPRTSRCRSSSSTRRAQNMLANPRATVLVIDPGPAARFRLALRLPAHRDRRARCSRA